MSSVTAWCLCSMKTVTTVPESTRRLGNHLPIREGWNGTEELCARTEHRSDAVPKGVLAVRATIKMNRWSTTWRENGCAGVEVGATRDLHGRRF